MIMDGTKHRKPSSGAVVAVVCVSAVFVNTASPAAEVTLAWDPGVSGTTGYTVYSGEATGSYSNRNDVGNTTTVKVNGLLERMTYYFAVTAYDSARDKADEERQAAEAMMRGARSTTIVASRSAMAIASTSC
jgi:hypothetical protein